LPQNPNSNSSIFRALKRAKRPDHAIKAFAIIKEKFDAEMWIFGDAFRTKLQALLETA
jgi:hypothetical protein